MFLKKSGIDVSDAVGKWRREPLECRRRQPFHQAIIYHTATTPHHQSRLSKVSCDRDTNIVPYLKSAAQESARSPICLGNTGSQALNIILWMAQPLPASHPTINSLRFDAEAAAWDSNPDVHKASAGALTALLERVPSLKQSERKNGAGI